jgi:uncharacterized protein YdeI (YjbR/CyaY-like superfamily)
LEPKFFRSPDQFRAWLAKHHASESELLVGYYKKGTGKPSMTWAESVDEALCYGWIDGIRRGIDDERYSIRFTPRKRRSTWSAVNIKRVGELTAEGRMQPAGLAAFEARDEGNSAIYSHEQTEQSLPAADEAQLRANPAAWTYWEAQPRTYRKSATWWVVSAKKEETRTRRLAALIDYSAKGERIPQFTWKPKNAGRSDA